MKDLVVVRDQPIVARIGKEGQNTVKRQRGFYPSFQFSGPCYLLS